MDCKSTDAVCLACTAPIPSRAGAARSPATALDERPARPPSPKPVRTFRPAGPPPLPPRPPAPPRSPWSASAASFPEQLQVGSLLSQPPRILGISEPWFFLLSGLVLAPILTFTPILRYMGWFLGSLFHETGHAAMGWFLGCPTVPAIRIDGHAAAIHGDPSTLLRFGAMAILAAVLFSVRKRPVARVVVGLLLLAYPAIAFTEHREIAFLLAGHLGEAGFATFMLMQALDGGFSGTAEERATHSMLGWYLVGRNVALCSGLVFQSASRSAYGESGSFGLVNDYLRVSRRLGVELDTIAVVMLVVALLPVPFAIWIEHLRAQSQSA